MSQLGSRFIALKEKKIAIVYQSPTPRVTDVDLKLEAGSSLRLSLDTRSTRVHSRRLTIVLITDAAKRWKKSSVYMSLPLTKGYFFVIPPLLALWADKVMLLEHLKATAAEWILLT